MLYRAYFIIVSGHNIKKMCCKILLPSASPPRRDSTLSNAHLSNELLMGISL